MYKKKDNKYLIIILLLITQMILVWHIDISIGAINRGSMLTNGWMRFDSMQIYHVCLYGVIIITTIFTFLTLRNMENTKNIKNQK